MDINEIGELLRNERINQGVSWEDIYEKTKITPYVLEQIEQGVLDDLPHPVYIKGFIKSYAKFLGLDSEELAREFSRAMSLEQEEESRNKIKSESPSGQKLKFVLAVFLLLLLIAGWFVLKGIYLDSSEKSSEANTKTTNATTTNASKLVEKDPEDSSSNDLSPDTDKKKNQTQSLQTIMDKNTTGTNNSSAEDTTKQETNSHIIKVTAQEPCWLLAEMDGRTKDVYLNSGQELDLSFEKSLTLKLGNAGGVDLVYDGENYPLEADSGEVKIVNLP